MANYKSQYTGAQIDEAVGKALAGGGSQLYLHSMLIRILGSNNLLTTERAYLNVLLPSPEELYGGDDLPLALYNTYDDSTFLITGRVNSTLSGNRIPINLVSIHTDSDSRLEVGGYSDEGDFTTFFLDRDALIINDTVTQLF